jgi:hypothetical protein
VAKLVMIFKPYEFDLKANSKEHLALVEWFKVSNSVNQSTNMFTVEKVKETREQPAYDIIKLDRVVQPCPLVPDFTPNVATLEKRLQGNITSTNCLDVLTKFWINSFHTKSGYQTIY